MPLSDVAFQKSIDNFADFLTSGKLQTQERDYKEKLVKVLGAAVTYEALASPEFITRFKDALREVSNEFINLTYFMVFDDFKKYVNVVPQERLVGMLRNLFDETIDVQIRFDEFDKQLLHDYEKYIGPKKRAGWLTALLLAVRYPEKYIFYRHRLIQFARATFGYEMDEKGSRGERYVAYLALQNLVKEQLAKAWGRPADLIDAHSFLWVESSKSKNKPDSGSAEKRIWKIAPGPQAKHWEMFRDRGCIAIAFLGGADFRSFADSDAVKQALLDWGQKSGSAGAIWRFTHRMRPGDIVVANKGIDTVVGIGLIQSDYIPPSDPGNPSPDPEYRHSRQVEWLITDPVSFSKRLFVQQTVGRVFAEDWQTIKVGYIQKNPELEQVFQELEGKSVNLGVKAIQPVVVEPVPEELRQLISFSEKTRNIILYGPPGTGKTYLVSRFAEEFVKAQLEEPTSTEEQRTRVLQGLKWWEAIALAMFMDGKTSFKVPELLNTETLKGFAALKNAEKVGNSVWVQLQSHTAPVSRTVNYSVRQEPYLFDKDAQSFWSLTTDGRDYVRDNLGEELHQLKNPTSSKTQASDFFDFVTFHQSFAYEEFVEGLKPALRDDGSVYYDVRPGAFKEISRRAEVAWKKYCDLAPKYLLIIDEINRANIAKVFGELITLIEDDKRLGKPNKVEVRLPYSGELFGIPPNLYIIGTMNTADRSIALLDLALRRRFSFVEVTPDSSLLKVVEGVDLSALLKKLDERIELLLDRDHRIGHSYLMKVENAGDLHFAWYRRILPLLQEYFYNDSERLHALLGEGFLQRVNTADVDATMSELIDTESQRFVIKDLTPEALMLALRTFAT